MRWDEEEIFNDGDAFFTHLLESIANAKKTISIETYIFDLDPLGEKVLLALEQAADRGVIVKLLLDGAGCTNWKFEDAQKYRSLNFHIQFFHPLAWQRRHSHFWKYLSIKRLIHGFSLFNHRNHRKVYLVDEVAYVGSMNVSARHLKSEAKENVWRDTMVRIKGTHLAVLYESFNEAWNFYNNYTLRYLKKNKVSSGDPILFMNRTIRQRRQSYHSLIQRMIDAKRTIHITNPYFIPPLRMRRALRYAIKRGVDVTCIFPSKSDFVGVKRAMEGHYAGLLRSGIKIFEYQPSMIHAKILITDEQARMGTSNLNSRSLLLDLEVDVEITNPANVALLKEHFREDLALCKQITLAEWKERSWFQKLQETVFFWFRWVL